MANGAGNQRRSNKQILLPRNSPERVLADRAYSSASTRTLLRHKHIRAVIPERADQIANTGNDVAVLVGEHLGSTRLLIGSRADWRSDEGGNAVGRLLAGRAELDDPHHRRQERPHRRQLAASSSSRCPSNLASPTGTSSSVTATALRSSPLVTAFSIWSQIISKLRSGPTSVHNGCSSSSPPRRQRARGHRYGVRTAGLAAVHAPKLERHRRGSTCGAGGDHGTPRQGGDPRRRASPTCPTPSPSSTRTGFTTLTRPVWGLYSSRTFTRYPVRLLTSSSSADSVRAERRVVPPAGPARAHAHGAAATDPNLRSRGPNVS